MYIGVYDPVAERAWRWQMLANRARPYLGRYARLGQDGSDIIPISATDTGLPTELPPGLVPAETPPAPTGGTLNVYASPVSAGGMTPNIPVPNIPLSAGLPSGTLLPAGLVPSTISPVAPPSGALAQLSSWLTGSTIISGLPNWMLLAGGGLGIVLIAGKKKRRR
jgi:hypothetical protein